MKAKLVKIGNSRGVRLPKPLIEEAGLSDDVDLRVHDGAIVISRLNELREGWSEAAANLASRGEDGLIDAPTLTRFDEEEWEW